MSSFGRVFEIWNRKLHFYVGLYFLFFLWLFCLSGLMLNHGSWLISQMANARTETRDTRGVEIPRGATDLERARDVMGQLGLAGEVDLPAQQPGWLEFNASRPSDATQVRVNLSDHQASLRHFDNSALGRFRILHTFSGSRYNQPASQRDWIWTSLWVVAMDALAAGLLLMTMSSYYMWWRLKKRRLFGFLSLAAGVTACVWMVIS